MFGKSGRSKTVRDYPAEQWERLWFSLADRRWQSLAIVATQPGTHAVIAANSLRNTAALYQDDTVVIVDGTTTTPAEVRNLQDRVSDLLWAGSRVILALSSPLENSASIPLARTTDVCVLCVELTKANFDDARQITKAIGESRIIGSVTMEP